MSSYKNRNFWMLSAYYFVIYMSGGSFMSYISLYYAHIGFTNAEVGMIASLGAVVTIFAQPFWGTMADRARYKNRVIWAAILGAASTVWLMPLADSTKTGLFAAFAVFTIFQCAPNPLSDALTMEVCQKNKFNFSTIRTMGSLGFAIAAFAAGQILTRNIMYIFPVYSVLMFSALIISFPIPKVEGHQKTAEKKRFFDVLKDRRLVVLYVFALIIQGTHSFVFAFHAIYSVENGIPTSVIGTGVMIGSISQFPFMLLFPKIIKRVPVIYILCVSGLVHAVRWLVYAYALNEVTIYLLWVMHGLCFMVFYLCFADIVSNTVAPELKASGQAMNALVLLGASRILGTALGGVGAELAGLRSAFAVCGVLCVGATAVFFMVTKRMRFNQEKEETDFDHEQHEQHEQKA
jgi:PPP family 3-phenylpropionic acid transporter